MMSSGRSLPRSFSDHFATDGRNRDRIASPGSQYALQLLRGGYLGEDWVEGKGRRALDIGCGAGFDLVSLAMMGWRAHGCDVAGEIVEQARANVARYGSTAEISVGAHGALPYGDGSMALVLAMNSFHYCADEAEMPAALADMRRVTEPGGRILALLVHPENWIVAVAEPVSERIVRIRQTKDFRHGHTVYLFSSERDVQAAFEEVFTDVMVATNRLSFFRKTLVNYVVTAAVPS